MRQEGATVAVITPSPNESHSPVDTASLPLPSLALGTAVFGDGPHAVLLSSGNLLELDSIAGDLGLATPITTRAVLEDWDRVLPILRASAESGAGTWRALQDGQLSAPIEPRQILQAGANYRTHVIDLAVKHADPSDGRTEDQVRADAAEMMDKRASEGDPYFFVGLPSAVTGPHDTVVLPAGTHKNDWELELVAVVGRHAYGLSVDEALDAIAGYTIANDLTTRELVFRRDMPEIGTDWLRAKNAPGFLPLGPWIVPKDDAGDVSEMRLTLELDGTAMQDESTKDMLFDVAALVSAVSQSVQLMPGDLILTGSPAGNGMHWGRLLRDGDVMTSTITGLGYQQTRVVDAS
ncbi:fumarylacetoacetate hydrolase family protein [Rhodococcus sp. BP-149]|nr:fumarylacetoacetate hydrolase family protein [Rhodococcus sp. BP-288]MBY6694812.1 fumarylacetoacetate hydrolase family protein [Rhodococcus sp. BP-188]MBY6696658.1 fumarylacetoacetate hydrolase family protein [Rhodococcus sp. BP-285]MBY6703314.1 fumarylacetoacetate hydrolase family protein [Rhodococcus sp. BP-283]MBY6710732.1 fumarylacetoacetate hydrolase family protein [Rhodococcus sp. BP-160]MBY6715120.1 fumarylacetoacetate hydrolase family protein [Rhodococcus sp. BP-110]MBY6721214.1 fu